MKKKADGDIGINVVHAGEKVSDNQIQRLSFAYRIPSDTEIAQSEAMKAKAGAEKTQAEIDKISAEIKRANSNQPLIHPASR